MGDRARALHALAEGARRDQAEERRREAEKARERAMGAAKDGAPALLKKCRQEARAAAEAGKTSVSVHVVESDSEDERYETGAEKARLAAESLRKDGFSVSVDAGRYVGVGSDPYPSHYYVRLEISF